MSGVNATLLVNPAARGAHRLRAQQTAITELLEAHGYTVQYRDTLPNPASTRAMIRETLRAGCGLVLACGGDGTVHAALQALLEPPQVFVDTPQAFVETPQAVGAKLNTPAATLGIVPLGTANALARNLGLPVNDPLAAVRRLLTWTPRLIPAGEFLGADGERRFFLTMAGCGPDGALAHVLAAASVTKARFGRSAYYAHAARLFLSRRWPAFTVEYRTPGATAWQTRRAVALLAARVPDLGGLFSGLTRHAALEHPYLRVDLLRPPAQLALPAWFAAAQSGLQNPWHTSVEAAEVRCSALPNSRLEARPVYAQADAEPLGTLPFSLRMLPDAVRLLMPPVVPTKPAAR